MPVANLLNAVSANTTGPVVGFGSVYGNLTLVVSTSGTVSAFSVQLSGSNDSATWESIGSAITSTTAGTSVGSGILFQYFQAVLSGYSGTGTVTVELAYSLNSSASSTGPPGASGTVLTSNGTSSQPTYQAPSLPFSQIFTSSGSATPAAGTYEIACLGGGGGGGGAGAATGTTLQAGGGGGGSGATVRQYVTLNGSTTLTVTVGSGGGGGGGGTAPGGAGGVGTPGTSTTVTGTGVSILANGGSPGRQSLGNSTTAPFGGVWATGALNVSNSLTTPGTPGTGGLGENSAYASGPIDLAAGGGAGGGGASATLGGTGGAAGTYAAPYTQGGATGGQGTAAGGTGSAAAANSAGGGGGGGGGAAGTGAGGAGGAGGSGLVTIRRVS